MSRPNIFRYANRELSQDAMVCWLLACLHSSKSEYRTIGLNFIRMIFDDSTIQDSEVTIEQESPHKQYYHMDVYAVVRLRNRLYPIIFENKTNTYLHSGQFEKYCSNVADWMSPKDPYYHSLINNMNISPDGWGEIIYVYFKTGYPFGWQKKDFASQKNNVRNILSGKGVSIAVKEIYLETMVDFLARQKRDSLLDDYYAILKKQKDNRDFVFSHGLDNVDSCNTALENEQGSNECACAMLFQNIFGDDSYFNYDHQHWASKDLIAVNCTDGNEIYYCFRFQWCKYQNGQGAYAFQFQQYRSEKSIHGLREQALKKKVEEAWKIKTICENIITNMDCTDMEIRFEKLKEYPCKSYDGQMILKIFIVNASSPRKVCDFVRSFSEKLQNTASELFKGDVRLLD